MKKNTDSTLPDWISPRLPFSTSAVNIYTLRAGQHQTASLDNYEERIRHIVTIIEGCPIGDQTKMLAGIKALLLEGRAASKKKLQEELKAVNIAIKELTPDEVKQDSIPKTPTQRVVAKRRKKFKPTTKNRPKKVGE